jgi:dTDP-4-dehydrorhamnose reductase
MTKTLIIGARGLVGTALLKQIPNALQGIPVEPKIPNQFYTDLTKYETLFKVFSDHRPDMVYLPAAMTHVDKCEESQGADAINIRGAITVLRLCESFNSKLIYFSSSYVFDGKQKKPYTVLDETNPINSYGRQKETVEKQILQSDIRAIIVRTVGVYGVERLKKNFAKQIISNIFKGNKVNVPDDQFMNPILSSDLARIVVQLSEKGQGLYHIAGDTCLSKYDFAIRIARYFGMENLIVPTKTLDMKQKALRPRNACLECNIPDVPSFSDGLVKFLASEFNG